MSVVCCQVEVSASGRSHVQSSTKCGVPECDRGTSTMKMRRLIAVGGSEGGCRAVEKRETLSRLV